MLASSAGGPGFNPQYRLLDSLVIRVLASSAGGPGFNPQYRLLDSLVVECWLQVREVPGSIPSQGPKHTKDFIKMVPAVPLFGTEH